MRKITKEEKREIIDTITDNPLLIVLYPVMLSVMAPIFIGYIALIQFQNWMEEKPMMNIMKEHYCLEQYMFLFDEEE